MSGEPESFADQPPRTAEGLRNDVWLVGLVGCGFVVARFLHGVPVVIALAVVVLGVLAFRPGVAVAGLFLMISWHAGHDLAALQPVTTRPVANVDVTLTADPVNDDGRVTVQIDLDGQRVLLIARTAQAGALRTAAAGDRLVVSGSLRGAAPTSSWRISRRIVGQLTATEVTVVAQPGGPIRVANEVRSILRDGVDELSPERRILFTGLVFGDDRGQSAVVSDNFRASGLGHLLAVSGQNVVFVLLLAAPIIGRISSVPVRVVASVAVLVGFGFMTRFEPSVTRALVMAGLALLAHAAGRPGAASVILPPAVLGLLVLDPLLAWSLAFQLSVAATIGLVVLTPWLSQWVPGPQPIALAAAATIGAQLAVSPLLLGAFGTLSLVAVPANLLAAPAAAGVMMWGLVVGVVAGLSPDPVARVLHLPTRLMLWWIDGVAATFARIPVGQIGAIHLITLVGGLTLLLIVGRARPLVRRPLRAFLVVTSLASIALPILVPRQLSIGHHHLVDGLEVVRGPDGNDVVILHDAAREEDVVAALRQARLGTIDLLVAAEGSRSVGQIVRTLNGRFDLSEIWAPAGHEVPGARTVDPLAGTLGTLELSTSGEGSVVVTLIASQAMSSPEPTIVRAKNSVELGSEPERVEEHSARALVDAVEASEDPSQLIAAVDAAAADRDELVALVSVLVTAGVETFETKQPTTVQRILDTHLAIVIGEIEVLES